MYGHTPEGKVSKCYTKTFPPRSSFAKLLSSATGLKNVFCAPCVFPLGLPQTAIITACIASSFGNY